MWKRQGQVPRYMQTTAQSLTPFPLVSLTKIHYLATLLALFRLLSVPGSTRKIVRKRDKVQLPHGMDPWTCLRDNAQWDPQWGNRALLGRILVLIKIQNHLIKWSFRRYITLDWGALWAALMRFLKQKKKRKLYESISFFTWNARSVCFGKWNMW
jgi:hypothetical protein